MNSENPVTAQLLANFQIDMSRFAEFVEEFKAESDRGCAVLTLCALEESLMNLFKALLPAQSVKNVAPRGWLARKIESAFGLGLLNEWEAAQFKLLAEIRNDFAHEATLKLSFESPEIVAQVNRLTLPFANMKFPTDPSARTRFLQVAAVLSGHMIIHRSQVRRIAKKPEHS